MTPDERKRVRAVFDAVLQRDPEEREAFLDGACAGKPWQRAEVAALLRAHDPTAESGEARTFEVGRDDSGEALAGRVVGPYIIRQEIGRGGMGVVYLADDTRLSRRVALKALAGVGREASRRERLRREAQAAATLSHPGIATVYALEEIGGELYLVYEYVPGQTLRSWLEAGPPPLDQVVDIAKQLARALAAAHAHGIVHRDFKPENIVRTPAGVVKVLDFGIARVERPDQTRLTQTGTIVGTPGYMAPEQVRGQDVDFRTDLFSFGVVIYEMASGTNPFEAETVTATVARILDIEPAPLSKVCPSSLPELDRIIATCLAKPPEQRYKSTSELVAHLERLHTVVSEERVRPATSRRPVVAEAPSSRRLTPRWWWEVHQVLVSAVYVLMIYPSWRVRPWLPQTEGMLFLFAVLGFASAVTSVRLHLWFTARFYPAELTAQRARALPWTRWCDAGFAASLLLAALQIGNTHLEVATLLLTVSIATAVASFVIEPATTRAAFRGKSGAIRAPRKSAGK